MNLGNNILKLRKENKLSQEHLAEKLNVTRQTISNWELGETQPTPNQLKVLSKVFKVSIDELLDNDVDSILNSKVSNTEKLAGLVIKILKGIGIIILGYLIISVVAIILFSAVKKESTQSVAEGVMLNCSIDDNKYLITIKSTELFDCSNCSKDIRNDIKEFIDYNDISGTTHKVEDYFVNNNGICE